MKIERVDDLPVLAAQLRHLSLEEILDGHFPDHGHWGGISGAKMVCGWLLYILSEADHRLSHVEEWAEGRLGILSKLLGTNELRAIDFSDDRLGRYLDRLGDDEAWTAFERALGRRTLHVYPLPAGQVEIVRADSFNAPQFRQPTELCNRGYSKQRRSDLPFYKVMTAALDPLAIPLAVDVVKGSGPDADLYLPLIDRVRTMFDRPGQLYVGDSQLGSLGNRAALHQGGDFYLMPLNYKQVPQRERERLLDQLPSDDYQGLASIFTEEDASRAPAYFHELSETLSYAGASWTERRILVHSPRYTAELVKSLTNRLDEAEEKIQQLVVRKRGRKYPQNWADLHSRIEKTIEQFEVKGFFDIRCQQQVNEIPIRAHKDRPARTEKVVDFQLQIDRHEEDIAQAKRRLGWQIYATNIPSQQMEASQVVMTYRDEYRIEHLFDYVINRDVGLLPIYLKKELRVKALIRLLMVAMRIALLLQQRVRQSLAQREEQLQGIYPGNKGRKTDRPTCSILLQAFKNISVVLLGREGGSQMSALSETQLRILELLSEEALYDQLLQLLQPPEILRET